MKVRNGFVSNSSSSSYIIYGIYVDGLPLEIQYAFNESKDNDIWWDHVFGDDQNIIGVELAGWEDTESINYIDTSHKKLDECRDTIKKLVKDNLNFDLSNDDFNLIGTTYYS